MRILGIDYGRRKIGLAFSEGKLAEPFGVIRYSDTKILEEKLKKIVEENRIEKVVVGVSEGQMADETKKFISVISHKLSVQIETFDETLTTHEAQELSIKANIKRKRRKELEDAYAACVMLQLYLEINYV